MGVDVGEEVTARAEMHRRFASEMRTRARVIVVTARRVSFGFVLVVTFGIPYAAADVPTGTI